jgi:serine/threonine protein phosphatase 1
MIAFKASPSQKHPRPRVPDGMRIYAIGDIHGRVDLLERVFKRIDADLERKPISNVIEVFLGDYIDRGPHSRQVVDSLLARNRTHQTAFLKGNHETILAAFVTDPAVLEHWQRLGGLETLMSYGLVPRINANAAVQAELAAALKQALPESHRQFLNNLKPSFTCGDFLFVHAGIRPGVPFASQSEDDLLWIREEFLLYEEDFGKIIVHGHTPVSDPDIRPNRINIDTGAYATGKLTCLMLQNDEIGFI